MPLVTMSQHAGRAHLNHFEEVLYQDRKDSDEGKGKMPSNAKEEPPVISQAAAGATEMLQQYVQALVEGSHNQLF